MRGALQSEALEIGENELLVLIGDAIATGVFSHDFRQQMTPSSARAIDVQKSSVGRNRHGMDTTGKPAPYVIEARRLLESSHRGVEERFYDWPLQVAEKTWVDVEAFIEAFEEALVVHADKLPGLIDKDMLFGASMKLIALRG